MQKEFRIKIVGCYLIAISLLLGIKMFILGSLWFFADLKSITQGSGGNLTGLGVVVGISMVILGCYFLYGFKIALKILRLDKSVFRKTLYYFGIASILTIMAPEIIVFPVPTNSFSIALFLIALNIMAICVLGKNKRAFT